ncbi:pentatricopeptide repeat-containing protein At3g22470, mitochondrial-like isoform X3 [Rhododendron vialii]|uniref:pentatricopeptide repeat-containing protein At3g22470, mitochondrial-like isoform X3 n=1 Tax=Rhododendron vialii TaxID=182163 RepID=UPI0026604895|nr:pentatricopeptide repeat-containing protein At3g22470, mitochondrial-like isoform X3 [Rhododendron vialii]
MMEQNIFPNVVTFNMLIDALCKEGRTGEAEGILKIMVRRDGFFRNRKIGEAIKVFRSMQDQGIVPNNFIYSILINGMCKAGKIEDARKLFNSILANGLKPNVQLYNTMICGLCEVALLDEAEELLLQMDKDGCPPNDLTFNVVVRAFLKRGDRHKVKIYL